MARQLSPLTPEQLAYIASCSPETPVPEIVKALNRPYHTVVKAVRRIRERGWAISIEFRACNVCGQLLCTRTGRGSRFVHSECKAIRTLQWQREYRKRPEHTKSTKYVRDYFKRNPEALAQKRVQNREYAWDKYHEAGLDVRRQVNEKRHVADRQDYGMTLEVAENSGDRWQPDEDDYILMHLSQPCREVAFDLGRTLWAVRTRRMKLLRQRKEQTE